jgi:hypothetical protein
MSTAIDAMAITSFLSLGEQTGEGAIAIRKYCVSYRLGHRSSTLGILGISAVNINASTLISPTTPSIEFRMFRRMIVCVVLSSKALVNKII